MDELREKEERLSALMAQMQGIAGMLPDDSDELLESAGAEAAGAPAGAAIASVRKKDGVTTGEDEEDEMAAPRAVAPKAVAVDGGDRAKKTPREGEPDDGGIRNRGSKKASSSVKEEEEKKGGGGRDAPTAASTAAASTASGVWFLLLIFVAVFGGVMTLAIVVLDSSAPPIGLRNAPPAVIAHASKGIRVKTFSEDLAPTIVGRGGSKTQTMGSTSVFVRAAGDRSAGETVLLMHGSSTTSFVFRALLDSLAARGMYAVAFDMPGHGLSAARGDPTPLPAPTDSVMAGRCRLTPTLVM